jgi:hypothetical protein
VSAIWPLDYQYSGNNVLRYEGFSFDEAFRKSPCFILSDYLERSTFNLDKLVLINSFELDRIKRLYKLV